MNQELVNKRQEEVIKENDRLMRRLSQATSVYSNLYKDVPSRKVKSKKSLSTTSLQKRRKTLENWHLSTQPSSNSRPFSAYH